MYYVGPFDLLTAFHTALTQPVRPRLWSLREWAERAVRDGWCLLSDLGDVMEQQDPRIYHLERHMKEACKVFGVPIRSTLFRPSSPYSQSLLFDGLSVVDAACLMVTFEQFGFTVDPSPLVQLLSHRISGQQKLSSEEFSLFFYDRLRFRSMVTLATERAPSNADVEVLQTQTGHRLEWRSDGAAQASLIVKGPRYRPRRPGTELTCDYCGLSYTRGDMDSSREHRRYHSRVQRCFDPSPSAPLRRLFEEVGDLAYRVDQRSPKPLHREMYERAVMFKREMQFDFIQWAAPPARGPIQEDAIGWLICSPDSPSTIRGACAFRERESSWTMDWAWIAPSSRRQGLMTALWPTLVQAMGDFPLETPLSEAMREFVSKHGTPTQQQLVNGSSSIPGGSHA